MTAKWGARAPAVATLALTAAIFVVDLLAPRALAVPVLYAGVVLLSFRSPSFRYPVALAAACTLLTVAAFFGPSSSAAAPVEVANGGLAVFLIWTILVLGVLRRRAERAVGALQRISERLTSTLDLDMLMEGLLRETIPLFGARGGCWAVRASSGMTAHRCVPGADVAPASFHCPEGRGLPGWLAKHGRPYRRNDAGLDPFFAREPWPSFAIHSVLGVPLFGSEGDVIGFLELDRDDGWGFTAGDEQRFLTVSRAASVAVQNALAYRKLVEAEVVHRELLERIISAQEEERRRISRELHDELGQWMTSLTIRLRSAQEARTRSEMRLLIEELRSDTARTLGKTREVARGLRSNVLDDLGLDAALNLYAADFTRTHGIQVDVHVTGLDGGRLPQPVETTLYRIAQESLTNAARHAGARTVSVLVQSQPSETRLVVEDDGKGFDSDAVLDAPHSHLGIHGMRERAELLNGRLWVESSPGKGTAVCVAIPRQGMA
jgi:signal transduction histidine kinase